MDDASLSCQARSATIHVGRWGMDSRLVKLSEQNVHARIYVGFEGDWLRGGAIKNTT